MQYDTARVNTNWQQLSHISHAALQHITRAVSCSNKQKSPVVDQGIFRGHIRACLSPPTSTPTRIIHQPRSATYTLYARLQPNFRESSQFQLQKNNGVVTAYHIYSYPTEIRTLKTRFSHALHPERHQNSRPLAQYHYYFGTQKKKTA